VTDKRKIPLQMREADLCALETRKEGEPQRISFSLSSETPVERFYGNEILIHSKDAVRLDRLNRNAMPLLFNHNPDDVIGMVDAGNVRDKRLFVDAHLFDTERAKEVGAMLRGGLRNVSVGYRIHNAEEDSKTSDVRVTDWEPYEASVVSIPADQSVGFGRSAVPEFEVSFRNPANPAATQGDTYVSNVETAPAGVNADVSVEITRQALPVEFEKARKEGIANLCRANNLDERYERSWVESGADLVKVSKDLLEILQERSRTNPQSVTKLDLSKADARRYSLVRALRAASNKDWKDAGLELECNKELVKRLNRVPKAATSFFVPLDVMMRDMTVAGVSGSNYLTQTDNQPGSFIDMLRNTSVALRMGVTRLSGLQGNVTIPKMTAGNTAYWLADENTQITESQPTIGQLSLSPKNVAALTEL
jgi:HK97 family phage prohead protease